MANVLMMLLLWKYVVSFLSHQLPSEEFEQTMRQDIVVLPSIYRQKSYVWFVQLLQKCITLELLRSIVTPAHLALNI